MLAEFFLTDFLEKKKKQENEWLHLEVLFAPQETY